MAMTRMIKDMTKIPTNNFQTNRNQVPYSTRAILNPPMTTPEVGVNKFTKPDPALKIIIITSGDKLRLLVSGAKIGIETVANPEEDGIRKDSPI